MDKPSLRNRLAKVADTVAIHVYFGVWKLKQRLKATLLVGVISSYAAGLFLLFAQLYPVAVEQNLLHVKEEYGWAVFALFASSSILLFVANVSEKRQANVERETIARLWLLWRASANRLDDGNAIQFVLREVIWSAFSRYHAHRIWLWTLRDDALVVMPHSTYPPTTDSAFVTRLERGEGVAGKVLQDLDPRYVPRVFFPFNSGFLRRFSLRFPHAVKYCLTGSEDLATLDIIPGPIEREAVQLKRDQVPLELSSFLCVPVVNFGRSKPLGVLSIDFRKADPISRKEVKMAVVFALLLAEYLTVRKGAPTPPSTSTLVSTPQAADGVRQ